MMGPTVNLNINLPEDLWRSLRRLAEAERGPNGRASVTAVVNTLLREAMARRDLKVDKAE